MLKTSRRSFLQLTAMAGVGNFAMAAASTKKAASDEIAHLTGTLVGVGFGARRSSKQAASGTSVVTELSLVTGALRTAFLPMPAAHTLLTAYPGLSLCLPLDGTLAAWVDANLSPIGMLEVP
ncbi:MAG: hypothetical protein NTX25_08960 [Proteobacteria bacterium]|nr:hypothetical protein [Pseudomonadota bacterium]